MSIKNSALYLALRFRQKLGDFVTANEVYYFIFGYTTAQGKEGYPQDLYEGWIHTFMKFLEMKLKEKFYPNEYGTRAIHFGEIMKEYMIDSIKEVELFYQILDEFIEECEESTSSI